MHPHSMLITAGPTHEPIDAVRYVGNRSSGRLGVELADEAARHGWHTTLLLGPTHLLPREAAVRVHRYMTTADLEKLLTEHFGAHEVLVMAAAVADYRPIRDATKDGQKIRRSEGRLSIELEATPDLLVMCASRRRAGQTLVGFALEPKERLLSSAREKLSRKNVDAIVANPLGTMDSAEIEAVLVVRDGREICTPGSMTKSAFAPWLVERIDELRGS